VVASAESFQVPGDEILGPLQVLLVRGFGAHRQRAGACLQGAPAPAEGEGAVRVGPSDVLDLGAYLRLAGVDAEDLVVDAAGVSAEMDEVPARVLGLDARFGGQHAAPFLVRAVPAPGTMLICDP
jgi:hypothetical protein